MTEQNERKYYGKYSGTVLTNIDPLKQGRVLVTVPDILGDDPCIWATSCSPIAGKQMGMYALPMPGDGVWVEFEQGNLSCAICAGSWRGSSADVPAAALAAPATNPPIVIQSITQNRIILSGLPGEGITIETAAGAAGPRIVIDAAGIQITNGPSASIVVTPTSVSINGTALVIN
jgi:hypothetical protein